MNAVGEFGYALVGILYLALTVLLLTVWRGRRIGIYLILACLISIAWGAVLALQTAGGSISPIFVYTVEVLRTGAWITFIARLLADIGVSRGIRYMASLVWVSVLAIGLLYSATNNSLGGDSVSGEILIWGGLLMALIGLVLVEQLYRNSSQDARWSLKPLLIGLGGMFAFDLFLYSQAAMFSAFDDVTWIARGPVNVLFVPLIATATRRNPDWELRIFVSRQAVLYTTTLTAAGLYLLLMSAGGYLILRYGGSWGGVMQVVFLVGAGIVLVTLLFSEVLRARLRVFLSKHFFQNKYDYRDEWLRLISTLSKFEESSARDVVVKAMAQVVGSPAGLLWVIDEQAGVYQLVAKYGTDHEADDLTADDAIVRFIEQDGWLVDLNEYAIQPDLYGDLELPKWLQQIRLGWLIVPVMYGKALIGLVLLYKAPGVPKLNYEDRDLLKTVGNHIAVHLAQEKSDRLLAEAQQFEAYSRLTAFLMHDLNNLIAQQSLIVSNAEKHKRNPEFVDDAIDTIANSVSRMEKVMRQLKRGDTARETRKTPLKYIVSAAVDSCASSEPIPSLEINTEVELAVHAEEFSMVLAHLIRNAQDSTTTSGSVHVSAAQADGVVTIDIVDTGTGMTPEFVRDRLFRPFDSTKGSQGMGIGAYQAREFVRSLCGEMKVFSRPGEGTRVSLIFPIE